MKAIHYGKQPFETLKIAYFKVFDKELDPYPFFDCTDEQILYFLAKKFHETVVILRIENVEVLEVVTVVPQRRVLDISELKESTAFEDREKNLKKLKIAEMQRDSDKKNQ